MQAKSRAYATEQIDQQREDFKRLGVLGDWERPYRTMDPANEAGQIRAFKRVIERGFVYRGLKPVYWCFDCGSSLAEFEIEYADKKSDTLDVAFESDDAAGTGRRLRLGRPARPASRLSPSSGPPPPGPFPPTRRSTPTPSWTTRWSDTPKRRAAAGRESWSKPAWSASA